MKVLIDGEIYLMAPSGGAFNYLNELVPRLSHRADLEVELLLPQGVDANVPKVQLRQPFFTSPRWFPQGNFRKKLGQWKRGLERSILSLRQSKKDKILFHSIYYVKSPIPRIPMIATVHDMITEKFPEFYEKGFASSLTNQKLQTIRAAKRLIAISEQTKSDIVEICGIDPILIDVIPHGVNREIFCETPKPNEQSDRTKLIGVDSPYLLFVGGRLNHKNFNRLLEAYAGSSIKNSHKLLVVGSPWQQEETALISHWGLEAHLQLIPSPNRRVLAMLYRGASLFVYPSLYEGFGMPLLEAMACGTPVLTSGLGSMAEVGGEAVNYFDPKDPAQMALAIEKALMPENLKQMRARGLERVKQFTWERVAELTAQSYLKAMELPSGARS